MSFPSENKIKNVSALDQIPPGAIILSNDEVVNHQLKVINRWNRKSEVFALNYGGSILAVCAAIGGLTFTSFFRLRFKLTTEAFFYTYIPTMGLPAIAAHITSNVFIRDKIILGHFPCTLCGQIRGGVYQTICGSLYSLLMAPIMCATFARQHMTFPVKNIANPNEFVRLAKQHKPKFVSTCLVITALQFVTGCFIAQMQMHQYHSNVMNRDSHTEDISSR